VLLFRFLESPKEKEMMKLIEAKGGAKKCLDDDKLFGELVASSEGTQSESGSSETHSTVISQKAAGSQRTAGSGKESRVDAALLSSLRKDLNTDLDVSLERNRGIFDRKFEEQKKQLEELKAVVRRESDRVISAVAAGPHDRILDQVGAKRFSKPHTTGLRTRVVGSPRNLERYGARVCMLQPASHPSPYSRYRRIGKAASKPDTLLWGSKTISPKNTTSPFSIRRKPCLKTYPLGTLQRLLKAPFPRRT
jgi:hypothetical protein